MKKFILVLNINKGCNEDLMGNCKTLWDYTTYVDAVRNYKKQYNLEEAVEHAIRDCINNDVLADFLRIHQREAEHLSIYEYDEEKHIRQEREEAKQEAKQETEQKIKQEDLLAVLKSKGIITEELQNQIMAENDLATLKCYFDIALKSNSIEEFTRLINELQ